MKKEKYSQEVRFVIPPSLYNKFIKKCENRYKTISEVIRELIFKYVEGEEK